MAERVGFEPTVGFPLHSLSRRALSTAQTPLRGEDGCLQRSRRFTFSAMRSSACGTKDFLRLSQSHPAWGLIEIERTRPICYRRGAENAFKKPAHSSAAAAPAISPI